MYLIGDHICKGDDYGVSRDAFINIYSEDFKADQTNSPFHKAATHFRNQHLSDKYSNDTLL
jgi:hypothetical protein